MFHDPDEDNKVNWSAFIRITGATPMDQTKKIVKTLEDLTQSLCNIGADLQLILGVEDEERIDPKSGSNTE